MSKDTIIEEMEKRIENFQAAMKNPNKRIGKDRVKLPEGYTPPNPPEPVENFDQLNKEDRWSKTKFSGKDSEQALMPNGKPGSAGYAHISVQDPNDPVDVLLPTVKVEDSE